MNLVFSRSETRLTGTGRLFWRGVRDGVGNIKNHVPQVYIPCAQRGRVIKLHWLLLPPVPPFQSSSSYMREYPRVFRVCSHISQPITVTLWHLLFSRPALVPILSSFPRTVGQKVAHHHLTGYMRKRGRSQERFQTYSPLSAACYVCRVHITHGACPSPVCLHHQGKDILQHTGCSNTPQLSRSRCTPKGTTWTSMRQMKPQLQNLRRHLLLDLTRAALWEWHAIVFALCSGKAKTRNLKVSIWDFETQSILRKF